MYALDTEYEEEKMISNGGWFWNDFMEKMQSFAEIFKAQADDIVKSAFEAYYVEKDGGHKYARVARVYAPLLREYLDVHPDAREIYSTLMLEQTQPFSAVESPYAYLGDDHVEYVEIDSYTGQPLDLISEQQEALAIGDRVARVVPEFRDDTALSISGAYDDDVIRQQAMQASAVSYQPLDYDEDEFTIDRGVSSEPIKQMMENELRFDGSEMYDVIQATKPYIKAFNQRRSEFFLMLGKKKYKYVASVVKMGWWRSLCNNSDERRQFLDKLQWLANKGFEPQYLAKQFLILQNDEWGIHMQDAKKITLHCPEVVWEIDTINGKTEYTRVVLRGNEAFPVGDDNEVPEDWDDLYRFILQFGNEILEEQGSGYSRSGMSERELLEACDHIEEEYLGMMQESSEKHYTAPHTRVFLAGQLSAVERYDGDLRSAGYAAWREHKSLGGAYAYNKTFSIETLINPKNAMRKAWTAFYRASEVVSFNKKGVNIREILSESAQHISWALAAWKLKRGEIFLPNSERDRLRELLREHNIGHRLQSEL